MNAERSSWAKTQEWLQSVPNAAEVLQGDREKGEFILRQLQVSPKSLMGSIALETGGVLFDHGWLRLLGAGNEQAKGNLLNWNVTKEGFRQPNAFIVAHDAVGGFFAMNGGAFPGKQGNIFYMAPDTLTWQDLGGSYAQLFSWAATGDLEKFYKNMRWPGWQDEVSALSADQGISIYPFLWAKVDTPLLERPRKVVAMVELWKMEQELAHQIQNLPSPEAPIEMKFD